MDMIRAKFICRQRMRQTRRRLWIGIGCVLLVAVVGAVGITARAAAQAPADTACRTCHGDSDGELLLPSGELLPVLVDLEAFNNSAHGGSESSCRSCHTGRTRYLYPHEPLPDAIESAHDYTAAAAAQCADCHYAHNPFHTDMPADEAPTCIDCHGSHEVVPFTAMAEEMPGKCLACHEDYDREWTTGLFAEHVGIGAGAEGYAGSVRCIGCHEEFYLGWLETRHAQTIHDVSENPDTVLGDFEVDDPDRPFTLDDVRYVIGGIRQQKYMTQTVHGAFYVLPGQWNRETEEWVSYHPEEWQEHDWRETCSGCHVTGLNAERWEFTEFGIGCESCHGPALAHSQNPQEVKPYGVRDDQVCGACHSRGTSPDGHPFPTTYRPGDTLTAHFTFTDDPSDLWPDGSARQHNQQYTDWQLGNAMALDGSVTCTSCHAVHDPGTGRAHLVAGQNETCLQCHNDKRRLVDHMPYHEAASRERDFVCADCHMPKMATSAMPFDTRSHTFDQPNPQGSIDHGGIELMPNACNLCHDGQGKDPDWAIQTIAYAHEYEIQELGDLSPGPTMTPVPLPTPLPSVGQPVVRMEVRPWGWVRIAGFVLLGLLALAVVLAIGYGIRTRSTRNV